MGSAPSVGSAHVGARQGGAGWRRRLVLIGEDVQPLNVRAVLPRAPLSPIVRDILLDWGAQCVEHEVFGLRFARRRALQSRCGPRQSGYDHKFAMHGLQNQSSCSVLPQPRSCPRSGLPFSSFTSQQTPHGSLGRGCGASPSGILLP